MGSSQQQMKNASARMEDLRQTLMRDPDEICEAQIHPIIEEDEVTDECILLENDKRAIIKRDLITNQPYKSIVQIKSIFNTPDNGQGASKNASGVIICERYILTVAHAIYTPKMGNNGRPALCIIRVGLCDQRQFDVYEGEEYFIPEEYLANLQINPEKSRRSDYALIKLKKPIQKQKSFIPLIIYDKILSKNTIMIYGYPEDRNEQTYGRTKNKVVKIHNMYGQTGSFGQHKQVQGLWRYELTTSQGMSGCPIILQVSPGKYEIIGIHRGVGEKINNNHPINNEAVKISQIKETITKIWKIFDFNIFDGPVSSENLEQINYEKEEFESYNYHEDFKTVQSNKESIPRSKQVKKEVIIKEQIEKKEEIEETEDIYLNYGNNMSRSCNSTELKSLNKNNYFHDSPHFQKTNNHIPHSQNQLHVKGRVLIKERQDQKVSLKKIHSLEEQVKSSVNYNKPQFSFKKNKEYTHNYKKMNDL